MANRYERSGFDRGLREGRAGGTLQDEPPVVEWHKEQGITHSDEYMKQWRRGMSQAALEGIEEQLAIEAKAEERGVDETSG